MMSKRILVFSCVFCAFLVGYPAVGQTNGSIPEAATANSTRLVSTLTLDEFQRLVQALGFQCERGTTDGKPDEYFTFKAEGRKLGAKMVSAQVAELFVYYTDGTSLTAVNEWNNTRFASTAYLDKDGDAVLENSLVLTGGVSEENVDGFITNFRDSAVNYARFIIDHPKPKDQKSAS